MKDVVLVVEGGGNRRLDVALRQAVDRFAAKAKDRVRNAHRHWDTVPGGGRDDAYQKFLDETRLRPDALVLLLIDSEAALDTAWTGSVWAKRAREGGRIFFMVRCMEAWIVADAEGLAWAYSGRFKTSPVFKGHFEGRSPDELRRALEAATRDCGIGRYEKRLGPLLLSKVDPAVVVQRCPSARAFLSGLDALIG